MLYGVSNSGRTPVSSGRQPSSVSSRNSDCASNTWTRSGDSSTSDCAAVDSAENHEAASAHNRKDIFLFIDTLFLPLPPELTLESRDSVRVVNPFALRDLKTLCVSKFWAVIPTLIRRPFQE